ncbi:MAG: hypothetical protein AB9869_18730 [Verrucomicrobiia bacterium]
MKSTTPSSRSCETGDSSVPSLDLDLPETGGFRFKPPLVSLARMIQLNRKLRRMFPGGLRTPQERWQAKGGEEFRL